MQPPPGSIGHWGWRSGGVASLDHRLQSGKPPACVPCDRKTNPVTTLDAASACGLDADRLRRCDGPRPGCYLFRPCRGTEGRTRGALKTALHSTRRRRFCYKLNTEGVAEMSTLSLLNATLQYVIEDPDGYYITVAEPMDEIEA